VTRAVGVGAVLDSDDDAEALRVVDAVDDAVVAAAGAVQTLNSSLSGLPTR
jgi:hypothetical protein